MKFEFDSKKSISNKAKHEIDFVEAQALWDEPGVVIPSTADLTEPRFLYIAKLKGRFWTAIYTERNDCLRFISVRRSRKSEEKKII